MKKLLFSALLLVAGSLLFTSCTSTTQTSVPQETSSSRSTTYSK